MRSLAFAVALAIAAPHAHADTTIDAESLANAARLRDAAAKDSQAYEIVESLTTEIGARLAGSPNDARAVAWAEAKFKALGFDRVWTEKVTFPRWQRRAESAQIVSPYPHELVLTALGATPSTRGPIEAQVIEFATLDALRTADPAQVKGKIAFIGNRMQRAKDGAGYGAAVGARTEGAFVAHEKGAVALLIRSIGTDSHRFPHTGVGVSRDAALKAHGLDAFAKTASGAPIVVTPVPAAALSNPDADLLVHVLERGQPVKLKLDLDVGFDGEYESANVIGEITGSEHPDEYVVIGGHLDSWDLGTGAIDDAAGVGITMAAAHRIKQLGLAPKRSIRVVAFSNEEQGLYGGSAYAAKHGDASDVAKALIGSESDFGGGKIYALSAGVSDGSRAAVAEIAEVLKPLGIVLRDPSARGGPGPDLGAMAAAGMAWAQLHQDGTDYFDYHHTPDDTLDKVDSASLDHNAAAYAVFAYLAAQAEGGFGSAPKAAAASN